MDDSIFCASSPEAAALSDEEFWAAVYPGPEPDDIEYYIDTQTEDCWVLTCARCGETVEVDDPENRERDAFCDNCASETEEESDNEPWDLSREILL